MNAAHADRRAAVCNGPQEMHHVGRYTTAKARAIAWACDQHASHVWLRP